MGALNREGGFLKFWLKMEGLIREEGLIKRGAYKSFYGINCYSEVSVV